MDKGGNFIGYMFIDGTNVSVALCEEGLASGFMTDRSQYGKFIQIAEEAAKAKKEKIWKNYVEAAPVEKEVCNKSVFTKLREQYLNPVMAFMPLYVDFSNKNTFP